MRRLFNRVLGSLNFSGRDWVVLLLALLLAFSTWLIHNLSLKYDDYLSVTVSASCPSLVGHSPVSSNTSEVTAHCRATGYNVITTKWRGTHRVNTVSIDPTDLHRKSEEVFYVLAKDLHEYASSLYGDGVSVDYFVTDTLFFRFPQEDYKKVPVVPNASIGFRSQYMSDGKMELAPDSLVIYGDPYLLDGIEMVYTYPIRYTDLHETVRGTAKIEKIKGVRMSHDEVRYSLEVGRYVEIRKNVPVKVRNLPEGKGLLVFPAEVEVSLQCAFPVTSDPFEFLTAYVDYTEYKSSLSGKCQVRLASVPDQVYAYNCDPAFVTCILEGR